MKNYKITQYASCVKPDTNFTVMVLDVLNLIKHGDKNLPSITNAREVGKGTPQYNKIKTEILPTFRFNFLFKGSACNKNITGPTGLIYIDVDDAVAIPESEYVFAKWKSLSDTGYGVLAKVDNLTVTNYREVYNEISKLIGVSADSGARRAIQQTVLSFDPNLYHNNDSTVFHYIVKDEVQNEELIHINPFFKTSSLSAHYKEGSVSYDYTEDKKVSHALIEKEKECIMGDYTFTESYSSEGIRFNNIKDYFTDDTTPYMVFEKKESVCNPYIPFKIKEGSRNKTLFYYLSQSALLNPQTGRPFLKAISEYVCMNMERKLSEQEINSTIDSVLRMRKEGNLEMFLNQERRVLFNPTVDISFKDKMKIVNGELGKLKKDKTRNDINMVLEAWDFNVDGKITQMKVASKSKKSLRTIKSYWHEYKDHISDLNTSQPL